MLVPCWGWSIPYCHDTTLKLKCHAGKRVIGVNYHIPVILIDLGNNHVLYSALVVAVRKKTHSRLNLIYTAKRFSRHSLLQRLVPFSISLFGRQRHFKSIACNPTLERSLEGGQQPSTSMLIL
ncbi:hypothetical protein ACMYR2_1043 [Nitrobacter sp. TKz-YC01]